MGVFLAALMAVAMGAAARTGTWIDEVIIGEEPTHAVAVEKLEAGDIDMYLFPIASLELIDRIEDAAHLSGFTNFGGYREFSFNPSGPVFRDTGKLNPFAVPKIREAMNWAIDRDYIVYNVLGGMGLPLVAPVLPAFPEYTERYGPEGLWPFLDEVEAYYDWDPDKTVAVLEEEMPKIGAEWIDGKWHFEGEPVEIILVIRSDLPPYPDVGDYLADILEDLGFVTTRLYRTSGEAWPLWSGDPERGLFHVYTGGWGASLVPREQASIFNQMYTPRGMPFGLWQAYTPTPELDEAALDILYRRFSDLDERAEIFELAVWESMRDSVRIWHTNLAAVSPFRKDLAMAMDLAGGPVSTYRWPQTLHYHDERVPREGGVVRIELPSMLTQAWNPVEGSSWTYDLFIMRNALGESALMADPTTGLMVPQYDITVELKIKAGLPVGIQPDSDWLTLEFVDEIVVPEDAWGDWDPVEQKWITVGERFPEGTTALRYNKVTYPDYIYDLPMHDGSTLSFGDFMLSAIMSFDRGKEESPIFDPLEESRLAAFLGIFKGWRVVSVEPLVIEYWADSYALDAENSVTTMFPGFGTYGCHAGWHSIALGIMAEENRVLAFSRGKADTLGVEHMDYTKGPSLPILRENLDKALATNYIPYAPTMGEYVSYDEALTRWSNLEAFYSDIGHFWVGNGALYLYDVDAIGKIVQLRRFVDYPFPADRWLGLVDYDLLEL